MSRLLAMLSGVVVAWAMVSGCSQQTPAPPQKFSNSTLTFLGYNFRFDGEYDGSINVKGHRNTTRSADGKESPLDEDITVSFGSHTAKILMGKLMAEGKDCGMVKPGDTIKLTPTGSVFVNDVER
jgi:hypothetical protein